MNLKHISTLAFKTIFNCIVIILHLYTCNTVYLTPCHATFILKIYIIISTHK